jgi:hypothetical protein
MTSHSAAVTARGSTKNGTTLFQSPSRMTMMPKRLLLPILPSPEVIKVRSASRDWAQWWPTSPVPAARRESI